MNLAEFLEEIRSAIKWSASTGYHRCPGCGRQMDSTEKKNHWPKYCSLSKDKTLQKLRAEVLAQNFGVEEKPELNEAGLEWYQNHIKITKNLPIDFKPTGALINEGLYPSTNAKELSSKDVQDLADIFSGKIKCRVKQVYTHDIIIDQIPMREEPDPDMFSCPDWLKHHNQAISETHALGLYANSIKRGDCDLPGCSCHELSSMKHEEEVE